MNNINPLLHRVLLDISPYVPRARSKPAIAPRSPYIAIAPKPGIDPDRACEDRDAEQGTRHGMRT